MISIKEMLKNAKDNSFAIGSFNATSITFVDAIIDAAISNKSYAIISISEHHIKKGFINLEAASKYILSRIETEGAAVALHLDHGETFEMVQRVVDCGFTSVMIDRSHETLEQNIEATKTVVDMCKKHGIGVEGELGAIGGKEGDGHINVADQSLFTSPADADMYVRETGVDALAVAIGNVHGRYAGKPNLDFQRLEEIRNTVSVPLVLHGGSGISDDDFRKLIKTGISKINFYSGNAQSAYKSLALFLGEDPLGKGKDVGFLFENIHEAVRDTTANQMSIFDSCNRL